jgi:tetratricopeptide (TPR) repeat protein
MIARKSLAMHLRLQGPEHPETGWGYFALGEALSNERKFSEALNADEQAMNIWFNVFPANHWTISSGWEAILLTLSGAARAHQLAAVLSTPQKQMELESLFAKVSAAKPAVQYGIGIPAPLQHAVDQMEFSIIYSSLLAELRSAGRNQEADECFARYSAVMKAAESTAQTSAAPAAH